MFIRVYTKKVIAWMTPHLIFYQLVTLHNIMFSFWSVEYSVKIVVLYSKGFCQSSLFGVRVAVCPLFYNLLRFYLSGFEYSGAYVIRPPLLPDKSGPIRQVVFSDRFKYM